MNASVAIQVLPSGREDQKDRCTDRSWTRSNAELHPTART